MHVPDIFNDCICCDIDNLFDDDGVRDIAEALKVNTTLADVNLTGMNIFLGVFHAPLTHSCAETVISKINASRIIDALKVNASLTSVGLSGGERGE